jgi:hypothetical protein
MSSPHRENEFWTPEPLFVGATVFVVAGGPSLRGFDFERLRGRRVLAVNSACLSLPWAELLYFMDNGWFSGHRTLVETWPGLACSASRAAKRELPDRIRRIQHEERPDFPPPGTERIRHGRSSGHMAVSLALAMGAARQVLLGFDMRVEGTRTHYHDDDYYRGKTGGAAEVLAEFVRHFDGWHAAALARGCAIVNATPGTALTEFPAVSIDDELAAARLAA